MKDTDILYHDLEQHGSQGSWDWEADLRFAQAIGDKEAVDDLKKCLRSSAVFALLISAQRGLVGHITRRRVRALQQLVRDGKAKAYWLGTGAYGKTEFGTNRVRHYELV